MNSSSIEDKGNSSLPEAQSLPSISTAQLVLIAADLDKLQSWVSTLDCMLNIESGIRTLQTTILPLLLI